MRRVVHITDSASRLAGGLFESVRGACRAVDASGSWATAVVALEDAHSKEDSVAWGATQLRLASQSPLGPFGSTQQMVRLCRCESPSVVHLHGIWGPASFAVRQILNESLRSPVVVSPRGMLEAWALRRSRFKKAIAWRGWMRRVFEHTDCLHALCEKEARSIRRIVPNIPIAVIPNGVNLDIANIVTVSVPWGAHGVPTGAHVLLFLGRLHPKKNILALIKAWARVQHGARARNDWWLVIAGWNQLGHEAILKQAAASLAAPRVVFIGPQFGADKAACLARASAFVLPSLSEGLPMAVLEAWAARLPVLMTPECNIPAGIMNGAAIECEGSVEGIAAGLARLLSASDEERRRMGEAGRALVAARFTWDQVAADMIAVYRWVLGDSERPAFVEI